jgi:predicted membrane protein
MRNRWLILVGALFILSGLMSLISALFNVDAGVFCLPIGLIALGVWLLVRPRLVAPGTGFRVLLLGDLRRSGDWRVADEEIWVGVGDVRLDMTQAEISAGETTLRVLGFIGDVRLRLPPSTGISVLSAAAVNDARILGQRYHNVFDTLHFTSEGYETAERRIRLEVTTFVADLRVEQG